MRSREGGRNAHEVHTSVEALSLPGEGKVSDSAKNVSNGAIAPPISQLLRERGTHSVFSARLLFHRRLLAPYGASGMGMSGVYSGVPARIKL
jgi:hypothetical protein